MWELSVPIFVQINSFACEILHKLVRVDTCSKSSFRSSTFYKIDIYSSVSLMQWIPEAQDIILGNPGCIPSRTGIDTYIVSLLLVKT